MLAVVVVIVVVLVVVVAVVVVVVVVVVEFNLRITWYKITLTRFSTVLLFALSFMCIHACILAHT